MRIRDVMTKNPVTVESETFIMDAQKIMKEHNIRRLPVVDKGKLVGIVTQHDLLLAAPSQATSLSIHEIHHLLSQMKVKEVMKRNPKTLSPDAPFEDAITLGQEHKMGACPIVEEGKLVGIVTESDLVRIMVRLLGLKEEGSKITIEGLGTRQGELAQIISIVDRSNIIILSLMSLPRPEKNDRMILLRLKTKNPGPIAEDFKKEGFNVTHVT